MSKVCIYGAGAIGGFMAARLHEAGANVSLIARGPHLEAIQKTGLRLTYAGQDTVYQLPATDDPMELGTQDFIIIALKAHALTNIVLSLQHLMDAKTSIVSAVNGVPWWYFYRANTGTALDDQPLSSVDPGAAIWNGLGPERAIGCVVYPACEIVEPGWIRHLDGDRFSLGEPSGEVSERIKTLSALMIKGGLKAPQKRRIRDEIWIKLWGNCSFNPVSALTGASLDEIGADAGCRVLVQRIMEECQVVGEALGVRFAVSIEDRIEGAARIIGHKPSTRQDIEACRPLEIDPLMTAVLELADGLSIPTPTLRQVTSLLKLQASTLGLYQPY
jgi:2-dehydropantoate 2-reductase